VRLTNARIIIIIIIIIILGSVHSLAKNTRLTAEHRHFTGQQNVKYSLHRQQYSTLGDCYGN